jgi:hypothetical protein
MTAVSDTMFLSKHVWLTVDNNSSLAPTNVRWACLSRTQTLTFGDGEASINCFRPDSRSWCKAATVTEQLLMCHAGRCGQLAPHLFQLDRPDESPGRCRSFLKPNLTSAILGEPTTDKRESCGAPAVTKHVSERTLRRRVRGACPTNTKTQEGEAAQSRLRPCQPQFAQPIHQPQTCNLSFFALQ